MKWALALCALTAVGYAQPAKIEPEQLVLGGEAEPPTVMVLTFGTGEVLFERWGHAALCFSYPHSGHDPVCFNWGVTDFAATDALIWGFLRGEQVFWMEPEKMSTMIAFYEVEDRDVYAQTLTLEPAAAREVERKVLGDIDGWWRYYIYDHFFDNCMTRIRDLIDMAVAGKLRTGTDVAYPLTFREMGYRGIPDAPVLRGLADFLVGRALDRHPTVWQAMFHPDVLREEIAAQLGVVPVRLYARKGAGIPDHGPSGRLPMLLAALVFALPLVIARMLRRFQRAALAWATVWLAGWGLILWTAVAVSGIPGIRYNEVALVLVPFDLALPFLGSERRRRYVKIRIAGLLLVSALCAIGVLRQPLWIPILSAFVPLLTASSLAPPTSDPR